MVDDFDLRIIQELEENGIQPQAVLGQKLGAAEATIRRREHRLLSRNALSLVGVPNLSVLGFDLLAMIGVNVEFVHRDKVVANLVAETRVRYLASCTGRYELLAIVASRSREELSVFLETLTATTGVLGIETFLQLNVFKNRPWVVADAEPESSRDDYSCAKCEHSAARLRDGASRRTIRRKSRVGASKGDGSQK